jgi:hypothetical protein
MFIVMDVSRYLLFVPHSRELEQAPFVVSCVCFPPSLLQKVERIF